MKNHNAGSRSLLAIIVTAVLCVPFESLALRPGLAPTDTTKISSAGDFGVTQDSGDGDNGGDPHTDQCLTGNSMVLVDNIGHFEDGSADPQHSANSIAYVSQIPSNNFQENLMQLQ